MKILYVTTIGSTMRFFDSLAKELIDSGNVIDIATNETSRKVPNSFRDLGCKIFPISTSRSPFNFGNIKAIYQIRKIAKHYDVVHCHTPLAAMATRFACRPLRKKGLKVIYTAHGFHFCKTTPTKNWIFYFPVEWLCSHFTDLQITINRDDYKLATKYFHAKSTVYVPGVGIDFTKFKNIDCNRYMKRIELGVAKDDKLFISVGELAKDKNHILMIKAIKKMNKKNFKYIICGDGPYKKKLTEYIKKNSLSESVKLLGRRSDIPEILVAADIFVFPSVFEGLPVSLMEAVASKKPIICSSCRGNTDIISKKECLFNCHSVKELISSINYVLSNNTAQEIRENYDGLEKFNIDIVNKKMINIYNQFQN